VRADITRGKDFSIAMRADFTHQCVTLIF